MIKQVPSRSLTQTPYLDYGKLGCPDFSLIANAVENKATSLQP